MHQLALEKGLLIPENRLNVEVLDTEGTIMITAMLELATLDEQVYDIPADWVSSFKLRWFPKWLQKRYPPKMKRIWLAHKFPEINLPTEWWGHQYVHVRLLDGDRWEKELVDARQNQSWKEGLE